MLKLIRINFCVIVFIFLSLTISAQNKYVSLSGSDVNSGNYSSPFASLGKALTVIKPGDTIFIRSGGYRIDQQLIVNVNGSADKWIHIMPYLNEKVSFNVDKIPWTQKVGEMYSPTIGALQIENASFVRIQNIRLMYSHRAGILIRNSNYIELISCIVVNTFNSGIGVWYSDKVKILYCEVTQANDMGKRMPFDKLGREAPHEAISIAGATNFEVAYNHVHLCYKEGIDCKEVSAHGSIHHNYIHDNDRQGIYIDSWFGLLQDIRVFNNIIFNCEYGMAISAEGKESAMRDIHFFNNLIYNNRGSGIIIGTWGFDCNREQLYIYNNTISNNGSASHWSGATGGIDIRSANITDTKIMNNICHQNYAFEIAVFDSTITKDLLKKKNIIIDNNMCTEDANINFEKGIFSDVYSYSNTNLIYDPLFSMSDSIPYNLSKSSPAIGKSKVIFSISNQSNLGVTNPEKLFYCKPKNK